MRGIRNKGYGLLAFVLVFFIYILSPIVIVIVVAFSSQGYIAFPIEGFSLKWFYRVYAYRPFFDSLIVSVQLAAASTILACLVAIPAALALARSKRGIAGAITSLLLSPLSMPLIVLGFALLFYLSYLGIGVSFLALLIAHTVVGIPYIARTVIGVTRGLPPTYEEAAAILGATRWQIFSYITLPLIRPGIFAGSLFSFLVSLDNLPISFFFGSPSINTLPVVMLSYLQNQFDPSIAAVSTVQMLIALAVLLVVERTYGLQQMAAPNV